MTSHLKPSGRWLFATAMLTVNLWLLVTAAGTARALMLRLTIEEMSRDADAVVVGTVVSTSSQWNAQRTRITTSVTFSVEETLKGSPGQRVTITVPGGKADGITEWVEDMPAFSAGERAVVFLRRLPGSLHEVYGQYQGKLPVVGGMVDGVALAQLKDRVRSAVRGGPSAAPRESAGAPAGPVFVDGTGQVPAPPVAQQSPARSPGWQTVLSDGFEGAFPGVWQVSGNATSGNVTWGKTTYLPHGGSYSLWCAGANSGLNPVNSDYSSNISARMVYGPFSLADAERAELSYYRRFGTEANGDYFEVLMSTDGTNFWGYRMTGQAPAWERDVFDLGSWHGIGDLAGLRLVWLAFLFRSNASIADRGVFLDDVVLRKYAGVVPQITGITPPTASAGTGSTVTISGSGFGGTRGTIEFFVNPFQPYGGPARGTVVSWTDTGVVATVPGDWDIFANSGPVRVRNSRGVRSNLFPFGVTFGHAGFRWRGESPAVHYRVNPNAPGVATAPTAVQNAAATWSAAPDKRFAFVYDGSTNATESTCNGVNEVVWRDLGTDWVLAWAPIWYNESDGVLEADIEFNTRYPWSNGGLYDVQTVATHELGHWLTLLDLYGNADGYPQDTGEVMYGWYSGVRRLLHPDDLAGIQWVYPALLAPPSVSTAGATAIAASSATLNGLVSSLGGCSNITVSFQWGLTENYTFETAPVTANLIGPFSASLTGLLDNTTYHYRTKAIGNGTHYGADAVSTTAAPEAPPPFLLKWTQYDSRGVAIDANGNVYVADGARMRVKKFTPDGRFVREWGGWGSAEGRFDFPSGLAVDVWGNVYVGDFRNARVQKFTSDGEFISKLGPFVYPDHIEHVSAVAVDAWGAVYVLSGGVRLTKYDSQGTEVASWDTWPISALSIAVDPRGDIYLADPLTRRINKLRSNGAFLTDWGTRGSGNGEFESISGLCVDGSGDVYVTDSSNQSIQKFTGDGIFITKWGSSPDADFAGVGSAAVNAAGTVYVSTNSRMLVYGTAMPTALSTENATSVTATSATLAGTLASVGSQGTAAVSFQWGLSQAYGNETAAAVTNTTGPFTFTLRNLMPGTTYHYRARAEGAGTVYGLDRTFTTASAPPASVTTSNVSAISGKTALLSGAVGANAGVPVSLSFEWGPTTNYTRETASVNVTAATPFSLYLTGLSENTTYHFRAKAAGAGTTFGADGSFTTGAGGGALIGGLVYAANGDILGAATVTLDGLPGVTSDSAGYYPVLAPATGSHTLVASKAGFRSQTQTVTVDNLTATYTVDFKGRYGIVPNAPDLSYVLACVNRWKFPPADGSAPDLSKVLSVVNAWKFPR